MRTVDLAMTRVTLRPRVTFADAPPPATREIQHLHDEAHARCFIASSVKTDVRCEPREARPMTDLTIILDNRPGTLAEMGEALGRAGVGVEGGGAWLVNGEGVAHFLVEDGATARRTLEASGITVRDAREVVTLRLQQDVPGQLGLVTRRMADAGVNIEVLYSDHDHRLVLVVDDVARGRAVAEAWIRESARGS